MFRSGPFESIGYRLRRRALWGVTGYRPFVFIPALLIALHEYGGEAGLLAVAALLPAGAVVFSAIFARRQRNPDPATGLGQWETVEHWLERHLLGPEGRPGASRVALMSVTVDDLDSLEDRVGVLMHDALLAELAVRLRSQVRDGDLIGRGVHSHFLICLTGVHAPETENLLRLAHRLQTTLDEPFRRGNIRVYCTISIGIAREEPGTHATPLGLIRAAEAANAQARLAGPGAIRVHRSDGSTQSRSDNDLASRLPAAIENGEIVAWYQPQISTDTGDITGFEALARWEHPTRGLVSPATFLALVERAGLSQRLAEVVLSHALSTLRAWDGAGLAIPSVAVNFSIDELRNPRLADYVGWELDRHEIAPQRLGIEVLESVIAESHDDIVARNLRALADLGCRIDLDDFGTGYTSILNIRRFSVSRIKIDRRLVARIDKDRDQRDLVAALLALAERLNIATLGEGVETAAEHAMLAQLGCDNVQGYAIARPMPLGDTLAWIREHRARLAENRAPAVPAATRTDMRRH